MLEKVKRHMFSSTSKGTAILGVGNIISALLAIFFTIIIARSLGPEKWGSVAVAFGLAAITQSIFDFGIGSALFRFKADKNNNQLRKLFSLRITTALLSASIVLIVYQFVINQFFAGLDSHPRSSRCSGWNCLFTL